MSPPIKNIYYMLAYVYRPLKKEDYKKVSAEKFDNVLDLLGRILVIGLNRLIRQGFFRDYIRKSETSSSIRGKINIKESIKVLSSRKKQLNFTYNEYSINNYLNQIIKTTLILLIKSNDVKKETKKDIRKILLYFTDVDTLDPRPIDWKIRYYRNNQEYEMLVNFCHLTIDGLLQTEEDGSLKLIHFTDKVLYKLYEEFIYKYYEEQCKVNEDYETLSVSRFHMNWPLDNPEKVKDNYLPRMETDIVLSSKIEHRFLIIDAKYYNEIFTSKRNGKKSLRSNNLYQLFTYVKSKEFNDNPDEVRGMLLYAGTDESKQPDVNYLMTGNLISVKTLDLNKDFPKIERQLNLIAADFLQKKYWFNSVNQNY